MATWTAATAIPAGGLITSAWMTNITGAANFLGASGTSAKDLFFARQTTSQSLTANSRGTANRINWDTEDIDAANGHGTATGVYMGYTAQAAGKYAIQASIPMTIGGATTDTIAVSFFKGTGGTGNTEMSGARYSFPNQNSVSTFTYVTPVYIATVAAGEVIDIRVTPGYAGASTNAGTANNIQPQVSIQWVGA